MLRHHCPLVAVALGIAFVSPALCAEKNASELELKTERVIVFKDGYALIIKRGVATTDKAGEVSEQSFEAPTKTASNHSKTITVSVASGACSGSAIISVSPEA